MKWKNSYNYILIVLITFVVYGKSIGYGYNLDDEYVTLGNERVENGFAGIKEIIKGYYYEDAMGYKYGYRPVAQISFAIEYEFFNGNPQLSHFINVCIYLLICCLIFYFFKEYGGLENKYLPLIVTLFFLLHPLHVEAVVSIKNREELFAFLFPFLALIIAIKAIDSKRWYLFLLVGLFNFLAIYSKQSSLALLVSAPLFLLLIRKINFYNLVLVFFSFYTFLFLALKDGLEFYQLVVLGVGVALVFVIFSSIVHNFQKRKFAFLNYINKYGSKTYLISVVILSLFLVLKSYHHYVFFSIFPLIFLFNKKLDTFLKISLLFPVCLFLFFSNHFFLLGLVILLVYQMNWLDFEKTPIKKEVVFICIYITLTILVYIFGEEDAFYLPFVVYLSLMFLPQKISVYTKYLLIIFPFMYFFDFPDLNYESINQILTFLFSIFVVILSFDFFSLKRKHQKFNFGVIGLTVCFIFIFSDLKYSNLDIQLPIKNNSVLLNSDYKAQSERYDSRVIDLTENPYYHYNSLIDQNGIVIASVLFYVEKFFVPYPISSYYGYNIIQPVRNPLVQLTIGFIFLMLLIGLIYFSKNNKLLLWMFFLALISLVSISNYFEVIPGIVGDRLAFTLVLPLSFIFLYFLFNLFQKQVRVAYFFVGFILVVFSLLTNLRVSDWKSPEHLFSVDVIAYPESAKLHSLLGSTIMKNQSSNPSGFDLDKVKVAKFHFQESISIYPDFFNSHYDLARVSDMLNEKEEAIKHYEYVIKKDSTFYDVYLDLTDLYLQTNNLAKGAENLESYLNYAGFNIDLYFQLSNIVYQLGDYLKVIALNKQIIQQNNQIPEAYLNIAYAYGKLGDLELLKQYLSIGEQLAPEHQDVEIIRQQFF